VPPDSCGLQNGARIPVVPETRVKTFTRAKK
jgi:hypothetical protein